MASEAAAKDRTNGHNGHLEVQQKIERGPKSGRPLMRSPMKAMIQDFAPIWFTWSMNTGIIGILMHQFPVPWHFQALNVLSTIAFVIDLVIFIAASIIFILRFAIYRHKAFEELASSPPDLAFLACWPIAWLTLCSLVPLILSNTYWGGHWAAILGYVMWWIGAGWTALTGFVVFIISIRRKNASEQVAPPFILPAVGVATVALTGGIVAAYDTTLNTRMAVPVIIICYFTNGVGLFLAIFLWSAIWTQLLARGFPEMITLLWILIGPAGQCGAALQALATAAGMHNHFQEYARGSFIQGVNVSTLQTIGVVIAMTLAGLGFLFILLALYGMLERAIEGKLVWHPGWNAIIFPTGTMCTSTLFFSINMDSAAWRAVTAILLIFLVVMWFVNLTMTILQIAQGKILIVREDPRVKQEIEEFQKES